MSADVTSSLADANPGPTRWGAFGHAAFTVICAQELSRYGVRVNAIAPAARTRMTESTPGLADMVSAPKEDSAFDLWDPANVSPVVAYLATESCPLSGKVFFVQGGRVTLMQPWTMSAGLERKERWTIEELAELLPDTVG